MKKTERLEINKEQINRFFASYYSEWRHIQILGIKKMLTQKFDFYGDIIDSIKNTDESAGDSTISNEISNGLLFDAIQHALQYIEDLFAIINASKNQDFFIKDIIQYKAGKISNLIDNPLISREQICSQFHFTYFDISKCESVEERKTLEVMYEGIDRLAEIIKSLSEFYKKHEFFYIQYKHGLSVAMRPYGNFTEEQIEDDKKGIFKRPAIVALDSLNFEGAQKNQYGNSGYLMMPAFSETIRPHINELQKENNLLRFVMSPPETTIQEIEKHANKTKRCLHLLIHNFLQMVNQNDPMILRLPAEDNNQVYAFTISAQKPPN